MLAQITGDIRVAVRRLAAAPVFTLFAVASLAIGIGVTTATDAAVRTLFWPPLGISRPDALIAIAEHGRATGQFSWPDVRDFRAQQTAFSAVAASATFAAAIATGDGREIAVGEAVSGDYFRAASLASRMGRLLQESDDSAGARVTVISEDYWRTRLGADPRVIGRVARIAGEPFEIVGVVRGRFHGLSPFVTGVFWVPLHAAPHAADLDGHTLDERDTRRLTLWARIAPGGSRDGADANTSLIGRRIEAAFPREVRSSRQWTARQSAVDVTTNDMVNTLGGLMVAGIVTVLLVTCTNLANLTLARVSARGEETAVRVALGASRWRIIREHALENLVLATVGGIAGVRLARALLTVFSIDLPMGPSEILLLRPVMDGAVLVTAIGATVTAMLVSGVWPAWLSTRQDVRQRLGGGQSTTPARWGMHRTLVAWQVTGSVALFLVAAMCSTITGRMRIESAADAGAKAAVAMIDFARNGRSPADTRRILDAVAHDLKARAGIGLVAMSDGFPSAFLAFPDTAAVHAAEGAVAGTGERSSSVIHASPEFAEAAGVKLLRGRWFRADDDEHAPAVAIVSEGLARALFRDVNVVGQPIAIGAKGRRTGREVATIAGVVEDSPPFRPAGPRTIMLWRPFAQRSDARPVLVTVRGPSAGGAAAALRASIRSVDSDLATSAIGPAATVLGGPLLTLNLIGDVSSALGTLALVLAMAGLFGVLSHVVRQRRREVGIRLALGASRRQVFALIVRDGSRPVLKGLALGLAIGIGARIAVVSWVFTSASPVDARLVMLLPLPFLAAAFAACALPALHAARVDPNVVFRDL